MQTTTKPSSVKGGSQRQVQKKFDGLLDLLSAKNVKIGRLMEELSHCRELLHRISSDLPEPVQATIKNRIRNADDILRIASH